MIELYFKDTVILPDGITDENVIKKYVDNLFNRPSIILNEFVELEVNVEYDGCTGSGKTVKGMDSYEHIRIGNYMRLPLTEDHSKRELFVISEISYNIDLEKEFQLEHVLNTLEDDLIAKLEYHNFIGASKTVIEKAREINMSNLILKRINIIFDSSLFDLDKIKNNAGINPFTDPANEGNLIYINGVKHVSCFDPLIDTVAGGFSIEGIIATVKSKISTMFKKEDPITIKAAIEEICNKYNLDFRFHELYIIFTQKDTEQAYKETPVYTFEYKKNMVSFSYKESRKTAPEFLKPYAMYGSTNSNNRQIATLVDERINQNESCNNLYYDEIRGIIKSQAEEGVVIDESLIRNFIIGWAKKSEKEEVLMEGNYPVELQYVDANGSVVTDIESLTESQRRDIRATGLLKTGMSVGEGTVKQVDVREHLRSASTGNVLDEKLIPKKIELYNAAKQELMTFIKDSREEISIDFIDPKYIDDSNVVLYINDTVRIIHSDLDMNIMGSVSSYVFDVMLNKARDYEFKKRQITAISSLLGLIKNLNRTNVDTRTIHTDAVATIDKEVDNLQQQIDDIETGVVVNETLTGEYKGVIYLYDPEKG